MTLVLTPQILTPIDGNFNSFFIVSTLMASFSIDCHITLQCPTSVSMIWYVEVAVVSQLSLSVGERGRVSVLQAHHLTGLVEQSHRCLVVLMVGLKKKEKKRV